MKGFSKLLLLIIGVAIASCKKDIETKMLVEYDVNNLKYSRYWSNTESSYIPKEEMLKLKGVFSHYGLDINKFKITSLNLYEKIDSSRYEIECFQYHNKLRIFPGPVYFKMRKVRDNYLALQFKYSLPRTQITNPTTTIFPDTTANMSLRDVASIFYNELNHSNISYKMRLKGIFDRIYIELGYYKLNENPQRIIMAWGVGHDNDEYEVYIDDKTGDVIRSIFSRNYDYPREQY